MKRFRFPLEPVLRWRDSRLETEQARLRELFDRRARLTEERDGLDRQLDAIERPLIERALPGAAVDPARLSELDAYRSYVRQRKGVLREAENQIEDQISAQRRRILEARRQCRLIEVLRGQAAQRWRLEWDRELDSLAGELFLAQWNRREPEAGVSARPPEHSGSAGTPPDRG